MFARELSDLAEWWSDGWKASAHISPLFLYCRILFYFVGYRYSIYVHMWSIVNHESSNTTVFQQHWKTLMENEQEKKAEKKALAYVVRRLF